MEENKRSQLVLMEGQLQIRGVRLAPPTPLLSSDKMTMLSSDKKTRWKPKTLCQFAKYVFLLKGVGWEVTVVKICPFEPGLLALKIVQLATSCVTQYIQEGIKIRIWGIFKGDEQPVRPQITPTIGFRGQICLINIVSFSFACTGRIFSKFL